MWLEKVYVARNLTNLTEPYRNLTGQEPYRNLTGSEPYRVRSFVMVSRPIPYNVAHRRSVKPQMASYYYFADTYAF